ncbi:MAG TPA: hypothetical protein VGF67_08420 [Ktedonobacteraceae bacterium]|jgi:hypothetical protein
MRQIGQVKQVQIQRGPLKQGNKPQRFYDPAPLLVVEHLLLTAEGVIGVTSDGEQLIDIHHATHPQSRNVGVNSISLGFTSHYRAMRAKFGAHLSDGLAGENILVEADEEFLRAIPGGRMALQAQEGGELIYLEHLKVAAPCVEFSHFALQERTSASAAALREALVFLDHGLRGFYATLRGAQPCVLRTGASLFVEV